MKKTIKKMAAIFVKVYVKILDLIISIFRRDHVALLMSMICPAAGSKNLYVSYQIKPKDTAQIPVLTGLKQSESFAIVLQGPICTKDDMTINTVRFYQKVYPYARIIVSTWNDEAQETLRALEDLGTIVVRSEKPQSSGFMNVNYQLVNSLAGIRKAKDLGCEFAVKTRTDQRICKPFIFDTMLSTIRLCPSEGPQKGRMVVLGVCGGGMFIPYHTCDFLYLGYTDDLLRVFSAPFDLRADDVELHKKIGSMTRRQLSEQELPPEIYIMKHYCSDHLGIDCSDTLEAYWRVVKNNLICFGMKDVDLMWNKYDRLYNLDFYSSAYRGDGDTPERLDTMCFDFFNWLNIYMGTIEYDPRYEQHADVTLAQK